MPGLKKESDVMELGRYSGKTLGLSVTVVVLLILGIAGIVYILESRDPGDEGDLVIISYTSFETWGLGPEVVPIFSEMYGVNVTLKTNYGDMGQVMSALKKGERADLVVGIDNSMLRTALKLDLLDTYEPRNLDKVDPSLIFDDEFHVVPYDYGYIAIICNSELMKEKELPYPSSVLDLTDAVYRDQIMLLDPAGSSTGSSFLIWAASVAGDDLDGYLRDLSKNSFNVFYTWDTMYQAFISGEAPMAISYGLDTAYDHLYSGSSTTVTIVPDDEGYRQIEGAGILRGAENREMAENFLEFMLTDEFQKRVGMNVMLPVVPGTSIESVYLEYGESAESHVEPPQKEIMENYDRWLASWDEAFY
ncbi:MAG: thiamine ABC transporter substrate-binding protein [Thermoplasmatota archaeon]